LLFAGEAYNVEQGITNELFQNERDENPTCQYVSTPNDVTNVDGTSAAGVLSRVQKFAAFMRFSAPATASLDTPNGAASIRRGKALFTSAGCALCHTPTMQTGYSTVAALSNQPVNLYSDLLLHHMGPNLADDIIQGAALGDEFRTAPLWASGSASSSSTTVARAICSKRSPPTRAPAIPASRRRRPTASSSVSGR
jgi:CxxC motif-containing protein (DUF1111 family)